MTTITRTTRARSDYPASDKQRAFITRLTAERDVPVAGRGSTEAFLVARHEDLIGDPTRFVSSREASQVIDWLMSLPKTAAVLEATGQNNEIGVYIMPDGRIVKVQPNKAKTNRYALVWKEIRGERLVDATEARVHGEWEYAPGVIKEVKPEFKMTLDQAKDFILRYGQCVRCSRKLKAADSVERGIGPVCIQYFNF